MVIRLDSETARKLGLDATKEPKYRNNKVVVDGFKFDSQREANRYCELKMLESLNVISDLQRQVPFTLIPTIKDESGKVLERAVIYKADFVYKRGGKTIVEDVKGFRTKEYVLKRKLMLYKFKIKIREIDE